MDTTGAAKGDHGVLLLACELSYSHKIRLKNLSVLVRTENRTPDHCIRANRPFWQVILRVCYTIAQIDTHISLRVRLAILEPEGDYFERGHRSAI